MNENLELRLSDMFFFFLLLMLKWQVQGSFTYLRGLVLVHVFNIDQIQKKRLWICVHTLIHLDFYVCTTASSV